MIYLSEFTFPDADREFDFRLSVKRTCYDTVYPFHVLSGKGLERIEFAPVTILYGGNGSGKTTALNVIGEKLNLQRDTLYNRSNFFEDYTKLCRFETRAPIPENSRVITSDDVFDFMLNLRSLNGGIDRRREELFEDYIEN
ncbi:MAG: AAA family ATPase, partial [Clostridia bacterium]|nr:AAA family ATPase [Clostridia bacterium]